jgi:parallel beta-helix repeat protein
MGTTKTPNLSLTRGWQQGEGGWGDSMNTNLDLIDAAAFASEQTLVFNVKAYGALGDGATSDSAAIIAAIATIPTTGGTLYFPPGVYNVTSGAIALKSNIHVLGCGRGSELHDATGQLSILSLMNMDNVVIENLTFTGSSADYTVAGRAAIWAGGAGVAEAATNCRVFGCYIYGVDTCGIGGTFTGSTFSRNVVDVVAEHGLYMADCEDCTITDNHVANAGHMGSGGQVGIKIAGCSNCVISGNTVIAPEHVGILLDRASVSCVVSNNSVSDCPTYGIRSTSDGNGANSFNLISSNTITDCTNAAILIGGGVGNSVIGNLIDSGNDPDINIAAPASKVLVSGNHIVKGKAGSYQVEIFGDNCVVTGNMIDSGEYGIRVNTGAAGTCVTNNVVTVTDPTNAYNDGGTGTYGNVPSIPEVATVASDTAVTLPLGMYPSFTISGDKDITSIAASYIGRQVTLMFSGSASAAGLHNETTLRLAGAADFKYTANDTITLLSDGTNWTEICRSVN